MIRFPEYETSRSGDTYVIREDSFWTLHRLIPGKPMGSWFELHLLDPAVTGEVLAALKRLHGETVGCFGDDAVDRGRLLELVAPALDQARNFLDEAYRVQCFDLTERSFRFVIDAYADPRTFGLTAVFRF